MRILLFLLSFNAFALPDVVVESITTKQGVLYSTVKNIGNDPTPAGIKIGVGYTVDGVFKTWGTVLGPLAAGDSVEVGTTGPAYTLPDGEHAVMAWADDVNRFAESDETNNKTTVNFPLPVVAEKMLFGVNFHHNTDTRIATIMNERNIKSARMDLTANTNVAARRAHVERIRANGGMVEVSLQTSYQWNNSCPQNFAAVEADAYNQAYAIVDKYKDIIHNYEMLNEIQLRPETRAEVPWNTAKLSTAPYENKPCYATMVSVVKGMSRAVHDLRDSSGYPLRVILGVVGRDFAFLNFMKSKGVEFDVVGYHIYPRSNHASLLSDTWFGTGGPLYQLSLFNKPVRINEFNCGDIYGNGYDNQPGSTTTLACFSAYKKHIKDILSQTHIKKLEVLSLYELLDEPNKSGPESRFGLMYSFTNPKDHLYIISAFAGGNLSAAERQKVIDSGALTAAEIDAYKQVVNVPLEISNIQVNGNTVSWTANKPVTGTVFYKPSCYQGDYSRANTTTNSVTLPLDLYTYTGYLEINDNGTVTQYKLSL